MNLTLLIIQIIIAVFLIIIILLQKSGDEGWSSMASNPAKMGFGSSKVRSNPLVKITAILAVLFMINGLLLANVVSRKNTRADSAVDKVLQQELDKKAQEKANPIVPMAE